MVLDGVSDASEVEEVRSKGGVACRFGVLFDPLVDHVQKFCTVQVIL